MAAVLLPNLGDEHENAFGQLCRVLLPVGGIGLMVACVMAANLDSCATFMVNASTLFTQNVYRRYMNPAVSEQKSLRLARILGLAVTAGGVFFAYSFETVLDALLSTEAMIAYLGISFYAAVIWKGANRYGAWASLIVSLIINYGGSYLRCIKTNKEFDWNTWFKFYPDLSMIALAAGFVVLIVVSYVTAPEPKEKLDDFYGRLHTPATGEEKT
jgi:SSS family solute:Na+ symporter